MTTRSVQSFFARAKKISNDLELRWLSAISYCSDDDKTLTTNNTKSSSISNNQSVIAEINNSSKTPAESRNFQSKSETHIDDFRTISKDLELSWLNLLSPNKPSSEPTNIPSTTSPGLFKKEILLCDSKEKNPDSTSGIGSSVASEEFSDCDDISKIIDNNTPVIDNSNFVDLEDKNTSAPNMLGKNGSPTINVFDKFTVTAKNRNYLSSFPRPDNRMDYNKLFDLALDEFDEICDTLKVDEEVQEIVKDEPCCSSEISQVKHPFAKLPYYKVKLECESDDDDDDNFCKVIDVYSSSINSKKYIPTPKKYIPKVQSYKKRVLKKYRRTKRLKPYNIIPAKDDRRERFICSLCGSAYLASSRKKHAIKHVPEKTEIKWLFSCLLCDENSVCRSLYHDVVVEKHIPNKHGVQVPVENVDFLNKHEEFKDPIKYVYDLCFPE